MGLIDRLKKRLGRERQNEPDQSRVDAEEQVGSVEQATPYPAKRFSFTVNERREKVSTLTSREKDVFLLQLEGYTLKEAAKHLGIKYSTANTHMTAIYKKLNVSTRAELIINYKNIPLDSTNTVE
jgi:DNA-binding CsgD family transcriptional regulator